jgi:phospholipase/lecithinase/hemolysin
MTTSLKQTLRKLTVLAVTVVLTACGGGTSTVDPFVPTRVIGLGDDYNVGEVVSNSQSAPTVRGTLAAETTGNGVVATSVVEQITALFGLGLTSTNLVNHATIGATVNDLATQTQGLTFSASDLVVITIGMADVKAAYDNASTTDSTTYIKAQAAVLAAQIENIISKGAKHVLVMPPLEFTLTPYARANSSVYPLNTSSSLTLLFNTEVKALLQKYISDAGLNYNPVIYEGPSGLSAAFNVYAFPNGGYSTYGIFTTSTLVPYCNGTYVAVSGTTSSTSGCDLLSPNTDTALTFDTTLFADGVHLTPAGNRWVASYLYNSTSQGWR